MSVKRGIGLAGAGLALSGLVFLLLVLRPPSALQGRAPTDDRYVIQNVRVVPMGQEAVLQDQTVIVHHGKITDIGPSDDVVVPDGSVLIDGQGKTLLPGLIDMHVHIFDDADLAANLAYGVTTVRNASGGPYHLRLSERVRKGRILGPRIVTSGPIINEVGGRNLSIFQRLVSTPEEARAVVRSQYEKGYHQIKVYSNLSIENYEAILDEARTLDMPVFGHPVEGKPPADDPLFREDFDHVLDDDLVTIEHLESIVWHALKDVRDEGQARALARRIADARQPVDPTLVVYDNLASIVSTKGAHKNRPGMELFNPAVAWFQNGTYDYWATTDNDEPLYLNAFYRRCLKIFYEEGVILALGTDAGVMMTLPGAAVSRELQFYVEAGLPAAAALESATHINARLLGLEGEVGQVKVGYVADLLLVEGNPLIDLTTLNVPAGVFAKGVWFDRAALDELHAAAERSSVVRTVLHFAETWLSK